MKLQTVKYLSNEYQSICTLRDEVLRKPIGLRLTEEDKLKDSGDILFGCFEGNTAIGCCILSKIDESTGKLRQMAVSNDFQGKGIGRIVLQYAEQYAWNHGYTTLTMHARKSALDFYKKEGYIASGEEFTEVGIPHFEMKKMKEQ